MADVIQFEPSDPDLRRKRLHHDIAAAVDARSYPEWVRLMRTLWFWRHNPAMGEAAPAEVRVPKLFYERLWVYATVGLGADVRFVDGEAYFRGIPIVPVED